MTACGERDKTNNQSTPISGAGWKRAPFFWILVGLSLLTLGVGVWKWQQDRQDVAQQSRPAPPSHAAPAPDFHLTATDGTAVNLRDLHGKVVLLNFWATWCPPCKAEMPDLDALYRDYSTQHDFVVLGVNLEESRADVEAFARQKHVSFPLLLDANGEVTTQRYRVRTLPTTVIIDRDGSVQDTWTGRLPKAAMLARLQQVW